MQRQTPADFQNKLITCLKNVSLIFSEKNEETPNCFDDFFKFLPAIITLIKQPNCVNRERPNAFLDPKNRLIALAVLAQANIYFFGENPLPKLFGLDEKNNEALTTTYINGNQTCSLKKAILNPILFLDVVIKDDNTGRPTLSVIDFQNYAPNLNKNMIEKKIIEFDKFYEIANKYIKYIPNKKKEILSKIETAKKNKSKTNKDLVFSLLKNNLPFEKKINFEIQHQITKIDWRLWENQPSSAKGANNFSSLKKAASLDHENPNRYFMNCSLPSEISALFSKEITHLKKFELQQISFNITPNELYDKIIKQELEMVFDSIEKKVSLISKNIANNKNFLDIISNVNLQDADIINLIKDWILSYVFQNQEINSFIFSLFKEFKENNNVSNKKNMASLVSFINHTHSLTIDKKERKISEESGQFTYIKKINKNELLAAETYKKINKKNNLTSLLSKVLNAEEEAIATTTDITKLINGKVKPKTPFQFIKSSWNFIKNFFSSNIFEKENFQFQNAIANAFNQYKSIFDINMLERQLQNLHLKYHSAFFKPEKFETFKQIYLLVQQSKKAEQDKKQKEELFKKQQNCHDSELKKMKRQQEKYSEMDSLFSNSPIRHISFAVLWRQIKNLQPTAALAASSIASENNNKTNTEILHSKLQNDSSNSGNRLFAELTMPSSLTDLFKPYLENLLSLLQEIVPSQTQNNTFDFEKKIHPDLNHQLSILFLRINSWIESLFFDARESDLIDHLFEEKQRIDAVNYFRKTDPSKPIIDILKLELKACLIGSFFQNYCEEFSKTHIQNCECQTHLILFNQINHFFNLENLRHEYSQKNIFASLNVNGIFHSSNNKTKNTTATNTPPAGICLN